MAKQHTPNYTVIQDTREKEGWYFSEYDKCSGMESGTLKTGDYTLRGFEEMVCIERKASASEIAGNLGKKKKPFQAEMERMQEYPFAFLVCEFTLEDLLKYPEGSNVPERSMGKVRVTGKYLLKCLIEFQLWYNVKILFCGDKKSAFLVTNSIFKRLNEMFHEPTTD